MAFTSYAVDRASQLQSGMILARKRHRDVRPTVIQQHIDRWFPDGVTQHGDKYLVSASQTFHIDPVVELTCELVRRAEFAHAPSRFESVFAWASLAEARAFLAQHGDVNSRIFEVETGAEPFRADMRCLDIRGSIAAMAYGVTRYWSQNPTDIHHFPGAQPQTPIWELLLRPPVRVLRQVT